MSRSAPAGVRALALRILVRVDAGRSSSSLLLERAEVDRPADRALLTELVLGTLRHERALDHLLRRVSRRPLESLDPEVRAGLRLGLHQLVHRDRVPAYAAVGETVAAVRRAAGPAAAAYVNGALRGFERRRGEIGLPGREDLAAWLETAGGLPPLLAARWRRRFGDEAAVRLAEAALAAPAVTLRVVRGRASVEQAASALAAEGVVTRPGRWDDLALVVEEGTATATVAFRSGLVTVQDEAAQLVARLVAPRAGERILDACAAPGGKTVAIADLASGRATIAAGDGRGGRLALVAGNVARTGVAGVALVRLDAARPPFSERCFDRILLDAPCTGSGTLRRNPELRRRIDEASLAACGARARALLFALAPLVRPGGRLVHATCSLEPEENDEPVAELLAADRTLSLVDPRPDLPEPARALVGEDRVLRTHPAAADLDGFTAFAIERAADA